MNLCVNRRKNEFGLNRQKVDVNWANKSQTILYASFVIDCRKPHGINLVAEPRVTAGNAALLFLVPTTIRVYAKEKKLPPFVHIFSHPVCACVRPFAFINAHTSPDILKAILALHYIISLECGAGNK